MAMPSLMYQKDDLMTTTSRGPQGPAPEDSAEAEAASVAKNRRTLDKLSPQGERSRRRDAGRGHDHPGVMPPSDTKVP